MTRRQPTTFILKKSDFSCCNGYSVFPWGEQTMFLLASQRWHFMLIYASEPKTCRLRRNWKIPFNLYLGYSYDENSLRFEKGWGAHSWCGVSSLFALWGTSLISRNRFLFLSRYLGLGGRQNAHDSQRSFWPNFWLLFSPKFWLIVRYGWGETFSSLSSYGSWVLIYYTCFFDSSFIVCFY